MRFQDKILFFLYCRGAGFLELWSRGAGGSAALLDLRHKCFFWAGGQQEPPGGGATLHSPQDRVSRAHPPQRREERSLRQHLLCRAIPPQQDRRQKCRGRELS